MNPSPPAHLHLFGPQGAHPGHRRVEPGRVLAPGQSVEHQDDVVPGLIEFPVHLIGQSHLGYGLAAQGGVAAVQTHKPGLGAPEAIGRGAGVRNGGTVCHRLSFTHRSGVGTVSVDWLPRFHGACPSTALDERLVTLRDPSLVTAHSGQIPTGSAHPQRGARWWESDRRQSAPPALSGRERSSRKRAEFPPAPCIGTSRSFGEACSSRLCSPRGRLLPSDRAACRLRRNGS